LPLPSVAVIRGTNNSHRRSRPSVRLSVRPPARQPANHENHESQEPLLRVEDPQLRGSYSGIVT
jgi:hypothetical protein